MKVSELKDILDKIEDQDLDIVFVMREGCCDGQRDLEGADLDDSVTLRASLSPHMVSTYCPDEYVKILFKPIPGYYNCRQIGNTIRDHNEYWQQFKPEYKVTR